MRAPVRLRELRDRADVLVRVEVSVLRVEDAADDPGRDARLEPYHAVAIECFVGNAELTEGRRGLEPLGEPFLRVVDANEAVGAELEVARRLGRLRLDEPDVPAHETAQERRRIGCRRAVAVLAEPPHPGGEATVESWPNAERAVAIEHPPSCLTHHARTGFGRRGARRQQPRVPP